MVIDLEIDQITQDNNIEVEDKKVKLIVKNNPLQQKYDQVYKSDELDIFFKSSHMFGDNNYDPISDAPFTSELEIPFRFVCKTLDEIFETKFTGTGSATKMRNILSNMLRSILCIRPQQLIHVIYCILGKVAPDYQSLELGMAQGNIIKTVVELTGKNTAKFKKEVQESGDLATTIMKAKTAQKLMKKSSTLTLKKV